MRPAGYIGAGVGAIVIFLFVTLFIRRKRRYSLDSNVINERWRDLQKHCASRKTWPNAVVEADELLADVLLRCKYKGKTTGERLVAAQRALTNNESVWFGHKLSSHIMQEDVRKLRKQDVLEALSGFRQALRDLGALK